MSDSRFVSIIVNNYNYGRFLPAAIESALGQTYPTLEVIVVDDGSTDESRDVMARYGKRIVAVLKENGGQVSAFNAGFAASRGRVVLFLDADDVLLPTAVERALPLFRPGVARVQWPLWEINEGGTRTGRVWPRGELAAGDLRGETIENGPTSAGHSPTSGNAWARDFLARVLPGESFADGYNADSYLFTLAPLFGVVQRAAEPLGYYRRHQSNYTTQSTTARLRYYLHRHDWYCDLLRRHLHAQGVEVELAAWKGPSSTYAWLQEMLELPQAIAAVVPGGSTLVLIDDGTLGADLIEGVRVLPMMERDGEYWGRPHDSAAAIGELERLRRAGAGYIAFVRSTFWWLEHYGEFAAYLRERYACVLCSDRLVVFHLEPRGINSGS